MKTKISRAIAGRLRALSQAVHPQTGYNLVDFPKDLQEMADSVQGCTMTSAERVGALLNSLDYIQRAGIQGAIVECGVWRGGNMMLAAKYLMKFSASRDLYLYDTFSGMSPPTDDDFDYTGHDAKTQLDSTPKGDGVWCEASFDEVKKNMFGTGYAERLVHMIKGKVEDTIPNTLPERIALLRLDTDWYESTKHELIHLYPLLEAGGVLIIDDYGHWQGARKATDEYLATHLPNAFLHRIDSTGRLLIKP